MKDWLVMIHWHPKATFELLKLLSVMGMLVAMFCRQDVRRQVIRGGYAWALGRASNCSLRVAQQRPYKGYRDESR